MGEVIPTATPPVSTVDAGVGQNKSTVEASPSQGGFFCVTLLRSCVICTDVYQSE